MEKLEDFICVILTIAFYVLVYFLICRIIKQKKKDNKKGLEKSEDWKLLVKMSKPFNVFKIKIL